MDQSRLRCTKPSGPARWTQAGCRVSTGSCGYLCRAAAPPVAVGVRLTSRPRGDHRLPESVQYFCPDDSTTGNARIGNSCSESYNNPPQSHTPEYEPKRSTIPITPRDTTPHPPENVSSRRPRNGDRAVDVVRTARPGQGAGRTGWAWRGPLFGTVQSRRASPHSPAGRSADARRRALRPAEEYRTPTNAEWVEREGWLGELEGLRVSLTGAESKIAQIDSASTRGLVNLRHPTQRPATHE